MTSTFSPAVLRERFSAFAQSLGAQLPYADDWTATFSAAYSEPQRHYHTFPHISAMLSHLDTHRAALTDPIAVELAVFFHDWVYELRATTNEAESVLVFRRFAGEVGLDEALVEKVARMIEATVKHELSNDVLDDERDDLALFLDFDLAVLGLEWSNYEAYSAQIRLEYSCFRDQEYTSGRTRVLKSFLNRERVYFSSVFYAKMEEKARSNIKREIELLESRRQEA
jgi:predicted metal-dependent HD superfamily phosphohydrolase